MLKTLLFSLILGSTAQAQVKVAVIDTGLHKDALNKINLCNKGHAKTKKGVLVKTDLPEEDGFSAKTGFVTHGTHISSIIHLEASGFDTQFSDELIASRMEIAKKTNYCQMIMKFGGDDGSVTELILHAIEMKADIINLSLYGKPLIQSEIIAVKAALDAGIEIVAAAGNSGSDLSKTPYYPAMSDPRVTVVGNLKNGTRSPMSNYGAPVDVWEIGNRYALGVIGNASHPKWMEGTSQAAAAVTGKKIKEMIAKRDIKGRGVNVITKQVKRN